MTKQAKILIAVLSAMLLLIGCGKSSSDDASVENENNEAIAEVENTGADEADTLEAEDSSADYYSDKIYYVGVDLPANGYIITCTGTDSSMEVVVFSDDDSYGEFLEADKSTLGEYSAALEVYAWADFYLEQDGQIYVNLKEENVILLDGGMCEFTTTTISDELYQGIYVVGEDISSNNIDITCLSDYMEVIVFENTDAYSTYHNANRFTVGEESDAIEANSYSDDLIYADDKASINLRDEMILLVKYGMGKISVDNGPIINSGETEETISEEVSEGIDPDFKEALDSYEAFMDEYIEFMKEYQASDDTLSMLTDYSEYLTKYADFATKIDGLDQDEMNDEELAYYIEVTTRVSAKLLEAAVN